MRSSCYEESREVKNKKELEGQEHFQNVMSLFFDTLTAT